MWNKISPLILAALLMCQPCFAAKTVWSTYSNATALGSATTRNFTISGSMANKTTESNSQVYIRASGGTFDQFKVYVSANTLNGTTTFFLRKDTGSGPANGNSTVSVLTTQTGWFEDLTHSDSANSGDRFNYQVITAGSSGNINPSIFTIAFAATTNSLQRFIANSGGGTAYSENATSTYVALNDGLSAARLTEANFQTKFRTGGSLKNMQLYISANTRTTTTNFNLRVGGAGGNNTIAVLTTATGSFEDTSHTDSVVATTLANYQIIGGAEVNDISIQFISIEFITTDSTSQLITGDSGSAGLTLNTGNTYYEPLGTSNTNNTTLVEADRQIKSSFAFTASNLNVYVVSNATTTASTFDFRVNAASPGGGPAISITALTTGFFEDLSGTASVAINDLFNARFVIGATGATNVGSMGLVINSAVATSSIKTWNGLAKASIKTVNGLATASVKTWNGLA